MAAPFFGRRGGPAHLVLAVVAVAVLALLTFVVISLNNQLDRQQVANEQTLPVSGSIVHVNDSLTQRLAQLSDLTGTAQSALNDTQNLAPLLTNLRQAIAPAAKMVSKGTAGAETSHAQLLTIQGVLGKIKGVVLPLVKHTEAFGEQGKRLLGTVRGLVTDLQSAVASAKKINQTLPLPG